jgi:hypothetical protein
MDKAIIIRHNGVIGTFVPHLLPQELEVVKDANIALTEEVAFAGRRGKAPSCKAKSVSFANDEEETPELTSDMIEEVEVSLKSGSRQTIEKTRIKLRELRSSVPDKSEFYLLHDQIQHQLSRLTLAYKSTN